MPRAVWNGFLHLSLVTCSIYLSPAIAEAKRVRPQSSASELC
jgi:non-homologous end joining protein Ku